jgi:hypothetical protein
MKTRTLIIAALVAAATGCGHGHDDDDTPVCDNLGEVCHDSTTEMGMACHDLGHDGDEEACVAMEEACLAECAPLANTLFVAREGTLASFDIATGDERPGTVTNVTGPVNIQALEDGIVGVNLTGRNEVLFVDPRTMLEVARLPSSSEGGTRPVHTYISPEYGDEQFWLTLNDGEDGEGDSASFFQIGHHSEARFTHVGEVLLGNGHHKAAFHPTMPRVVISNIGDCDVALAVFDFSNMADIQTLATLSGADAGFDGADPGEGNFNPTFCDPTYQRGLPPAPHGCDTASASGKAYCNITSSGDMVVVDMAADPPTFTLLATDGSGGGKTHTHPDGRYVYTLQESPREGAGGTDCQIGQLVVTDAMTDQIVDQVALGYTGPGCTDVLTGTAAATANADNLFFSGDYLFVGTAGGFGDADARVDQRLVIDVSQPEAPTQLASIAVGVSTGHSGDNLSGDGAFYFALDAVDGTVSQIDTDTLEVVATLDVGDSPKNLACFGTAEGPSPQVGPVH